MRLLPHVLTAGGRGTERERETGGGGRQGRRPGNPATATLPREGGGGEEREGTPGGGHLAQCPLQLVSRPITSRSRYWRRFITVGDFL